MPKNTYFSRLIWLVAQTSTDATGDVIVTHRPGQSLWASVEETNGRRTDEAGAPQTGVDVEIRIRNYPEVATTDLLQDEYLGYVYRIDSIRNGDDEIIVDAYRYDTLNHYTIEDDS